MNGRKVILWPSHRSTIGHSTPAARQFHTVALRRGLDELATVIARGMCSAKHWYTN
jgi:hypothetical protein